MEIFVILRVGRYTHYIDLYIRSPGRNIKMDENVLCYYYTNESDEMIRILFVKTRE